MSTGVLTVDMTEAIKKTRVLMSIPKTARDGVMKWAIGTVEALKKSAIAKLGKSGRLPGAKSSQLARNIGIEGNLTGEHFQIAVGTGVQGKLNVKYAWIQDQGGTTHPTVTPRMKRYMWWRHYKEFGREVRGMGLRGAERKGAFMTWGQKGQSVFKAIALMRTGTKLNVKIPASHWFTDVIRQREPGLKAIMTAGAILREAEHWATTEPNIGEKYEGSYD